MILNAITAWAEDEMERLTDRFGQITSLSELPGEREVIGGYNLVVRGLYSFITNPYSDTSVNSVEQN